MKPQQNYSYDVFISYRWISPDQVWVRNNLQPALTKAGLRVCLDVLDFVPGRDLILEMERAGLESRHILCVISPEYFEAGRVVDFENLMARRRDPTGQHSVLIPFMFRETDLPERMRGLIPIDWLNADNHKREWNKLLKVLGAPNMDAPIPAVEVKSVSESSEKLETSIQNEKLSTRNLDEEISFEKQHFKFTNQVKIPLTTFPQPLNFFTGREPVLKDIYTVLNRHQNASLYGIHGLGKTSVVTEYAHRYIENYNYVFFIRATNDDFFSQMAECASDLGYEFDSETTVEEKVRKFRTWLTQNRGWLLILDNIEDVNQIKKYPFPNENGHIIYTSNFSWVRNFGSKVSFEVMEKDEAELLLFRRAEQNSKILHNYISKDALPIIREIVSELGLLPLAINIAGSYIAENQKTFADFLALYRDYGDEFLTLEDESDSYPYQSVFKVFSMAFESISNPKNENERARLISESAVYCLKTASLLAPDNIPEEIFKEVVALKGKEYKTFIENELNWDAVVREFVSYRLFHKDALTKTFSTHRLLQKVIFSKVKDDEKKLVEHLTQALDKLFPEFEFENKSICDKYVPHLQVLLDYLAKNSSSLLMLFQLSNESIPNLILKISEYYYHIGQFDTASQYFRISYKLNTEFFGFENKHTLESYHNLAITYLNQSKFKQAIKFLEEIIRTQEKNLEIIHKDTIKSCNELIGIYYDSGNSYKGERLYRRVYGLHERIIESTDIEILLAYIKCLTYNFRYYNTLDIESVCIKLVRKIEYISGSDNIKTAESYAALNLIYFEERDYEKAEKICKKIIEKIRNLEIPNLNMLIGQYINLSVIYGRHKKFDEARKLLEESIDELENVAPNTIMKFDIMARLAHIHLWEKNYKDAELIWQELLARYNSIWGENNFSSLNCITNLGILSLEQNKAKEAVVFFQKSAKGFEKILGYNHFTTKEMRNRLKNARTKLTNKN